MLLIGNSELYPSRLARDNFERLIARFKFQPRNPRRSHLPMSTTETNQSEDAGGRRLAAGKTRATQTLKDS